MQLAELFDVRVLGEEVMRALPPSVVVVFELVGEGVYFVSRGDDGVEIGRGDRDTWDCRLRCSADDFRGLLRGEFSGMEGYRTGRLRIEGDVGLIFKLHRFARPVS